MDKPTEDYIEAITRMVDNTSKHLEDEQVWLSIVTAILADPEASSVEHICLAADKFVLEFHKRFRA